MKLKQKDKKILSYLYHHYRQPLTEVGKQCLVSRDQVEYTLNKYEAEGVIRKYLTILNYSLLGYNEFIIIWIKTPKKEQVKKELQTMKNVLSDRAWCAAAEVICNSLYNWIDGVGSIPRIFALDATNKVASCKGRHAPFS